MRYEIPIIQLTAVSLAAIRGQGTSGPGKPGPSCNDATGTTSTGAYELDE